MVHVINMDYSAEEMEKGAGEMAWQLRTLTALTKVLRSVSVLKRCLQPFIMGSCALFWCADIALIYIKCINKIFLKRWKRERVEEEFLTHSLVLG